MKKIILLPFALFSLVLAAQSTKEANVYPSNLEENIYFEKYDAATKTISGIYFMVLSDGDNSKDVTPAFEVCLYLIPQGSTNKEDVIIIKTYSLKGIYHMGSMEFKAQSVSLEGIEGIKQGTYRLGIWVNSNQAFTENGSDNAILFANAITISESLATKPTLDSPAKKVEQQEEGNEENENDGW